MVHDVKGSGGLTKQRVLIVDDSPQVRQELRTLLTLAGDIEIVGEAADGLEAIRLTKVLQPEVVLLDLQMPVMDGYQTAWQIKVDWPECRVVALTMHGDEATRQEATQAGVDTLLVKGVSLDTLVQAICERKESANGFQQLTRAKE